MGGMDIASIETAAYMERRFEIMGEGTTSLGLGAALGKPPHGVL